MALTVLDAQVERWRLLYEESMSNGNWVAQCNALYAQRLIAQREMVTFLDSYITGKISMEEFRATFDRKTP